MSTLIVTIILSCLLPSWIGYVSRSRLVALPAVILWGLGTLMVVLCLAAPNGVWLTGNPWVRQMILESSFQADTLTGSDGTPFRVFMTTRNGSESFEIDNTVATGADGLPRQPSKPPTAVEVLDESLWSIWMVGAWAPLFIVQLVLLAYTLGTESRRERAAADHRTRRRRKMQILRT